MKTVIPLNTIVEYKLTSNSSPLSFDTVDQIMKLAHEAYKAEKGVLSVFPLDKLDKDIEWKWQTDRGSLPKRIESWFYKQHKIKLSSVVTSNIGNVARAVIPKDQIYYFDFTKDLNWNQGDFGDHGSCFFRPDGPGYQPEAMKNSGRFYGVRFFKKVPQNSNMSLDVEKFYENEDGYYIGISRAWMGESPRTNSTLKVLFNGYGLTTNQISTIVADYLEADRKRVYITGTDLYMNGDGYVIGDSGEVNKLGDSFNLDFAS